MSPKKKRVLLNYEPDTPRCANCVFKTWRPDLRVASLTSWCNWSGFVLPGTGGLCDAWRGKGGTELESDPKESKPQ